MTIPRKSVSAASCSARRATGTETTSANDSSRSVGDTGRRCENRTTSRTTPGAIKGLFRAASKRSRGALRVRRHRRAGGAAARPAALSAEPRGPILRRAVRLPPQAFAAAMFLTDTLEWLNYWHGRSPTAAASHYELGRKSKRPFAAALVLLDVCAWRTTPTTTPRLPPTRVDVKARRPETQMSCAGSKSALHVIDANGVVHVFIDRMPVGRLTGYVYLAPVGTPPPSPIRSRSAPAKTTKTEIERARITGDRDQANSGRAVREFPSRAGR